MRLLDRKPKKTFDERVQELVERDVAEQERRQLEQTIILDTVGRTTDTAAHKALEVLAELPEDQREVFMKNVFRLLIVQALHSADSLDIKTALHLWSGARSHYGSGSELEYIPASYDVNVVGHAAEQLASTEETSHA